MYAPATLRKELSQCYPLDGQNGLEQMRSGKKLADSWELLEKIMVHVPVRLGLPLLSKHLSGLEGHDMCFACEH